MYTNTEIDTIFKNCETTADVYSAVKSFDFLIKEKYMVRTNYLFAMSKMRFSEILKRNKS